MAQTIGLKGEFIRKEVPATGVITPGMQVSILGAAGGGLRKAFALENDLVGRSISDDYAIGEVVQVGLFPQGSEVLALLGAGENAAKGSPLVSDGDGTLAVAGSGEEGEVIAFALEAINNTAGSAPARIVVEVS